MVELNINLSKKWQKESFYYVTFVLKIKKKKKQPLIQFRIVLSHDCALHNVFQFYIFIVTFAME